ncbi:MULTISPECIES: bifunctional DNA-formamidopyrimidine glycosylase/DNA-(apurinic or apyrimidinic site) lyase [unclassified Oleiphilus]|nr:MULTISPECIES: bifunctional DNA-formamidopyrimidine glycosylase/DNA-(apurinic or apyrimidinic site) lyase [unclassified Oleiphilus]KZY48832.1 DNA-formamidopyrimidine glycosylase [Oleiphilus sp. HI0050]KZY73895.1 DNA-formamidopyrimidine glycosylase [Oleiphilus sp. HI0068]KZY85340.1 DNA-formamidopyrimidine glycosylase [Oleiphilus sp. HI0069]KZY89130.1 DNA-formamidopyrimidine glycosylase [Oleiphilus sp. HI0072]KZZ10527.1 DNA-formamidopyrimidine glycosylase [Oleiphilus sp. HI0078]KZZ22523.1 DNA
MPELPEVETSRRGIEPYIKGHKILSIKIYQQALRWPVSNELYEMTNQPVSDVLRRGKYIIICVPDGSILLHLGMSGSLRIVDERTPRIKHDHVEFHLSCGKILRFNDPRRFGSILWSSNWQAHPLIASLGLEPLNEEFDGAYLHQAAKKRKQAVKQFLMNSKLVVGVGNIYANEALFKAGISPIRSASQISLKRYNLLADTIKEVLRKSIKQGGTTLKDFVGSDGKPGYFKQELNVYGRGGEACVECGQALKEIRQGNRATVYCSQCQK